MRKRTDKEKRLDEYLAEKEQRRRQREEKIARVLQILDDIDCCPGYSLSDSGMEKFWNVQELAREILKDDAASQHNKPPTA